MAIRIIIADDVLEMREMIDKMLQSSGLDYKVVATCENGLEVIEVLRSQEVDIVLMDINMPIMNGLDATDLIAKQYPQTMVIIMSVQQESEYLKKAMLAGAKAYIIKPVDMDELIDTINTTYGRYANTNIINKAVPQQNDAKIFCYFSGKGGVGKSVIAVNSGLLISERQHKKVLIIDLDLQFGDISLILNKQSELTIKELFDDSPIKSYDSIRPYLYHYREGVDLLFAPRDPESAEYISSEQVKSIIEILKSYYDYIVIDTGVNYNEVTLNAFDLSDYIFVVSTMEVTSLKNLKMSLKVMQSLNAESKVKLIFNMDSEKYGVTKGNVQKAFSNEIIGFIPEDVKVVRTSVNTGIPIVSSKNNALYKSFLKLSQVILDLK